MVTEQQTDAYIDFAAKLAAAFGEGTEAAAIEPLALAGVHVGVGVYHLLRGLVHHIKQPAAPTVTTTPVVPPATPTVTATNPGAGVAQPG